MNKYLVLLLIFVFSCQNNPCHDGDSFTFQRLSSISWSNDNKKIAFLYANGAKNNTISSQLYIINSDGTSLKKAYELQKIGFSNLSYNLDNILNFNFNWSNKDNEIFYFDERGLEKIFFDNSSFIYYPVSTEKEISLAFDNKSAISGNKVTNIENHKQYKININTENSKLIDDGNLDIGWMPYKSNKVFISDNNTVNSDKTTRNYAYGDLNINNGLVENIEIITEINKKDSNLVIEKFLAMIEQNIFYLKGDGNIYEFNTITKKETKFFGGEKFTSHEKNIVISRDGKYFAYFKNVYYTGNDLSVLILHESSLIIIDINTKEEKEILNIKNLESGEKIKEQHCSYDL